MKLIPLHNLRTPSVSVLSFLRSQLFDVAETPTSRCASVRGKAWRGLSTRAAGELGSGGRRGQEWAGKDTVQLGFTASRRKCFLESRIRCLGSNAFRSSARILHSPFDFLENPLLCRRAFSTTPQNRVWHLWGSGKHRTTKPREEHTSPLTSFLDDNGGGLGGLGRVTRPTNELKLRCTELDEQGNVTMVSGEFKKSELIAKYGLLPRDLRKIDSSLLPHIFVRPSAILINLLHLRVLIKHNRVLVFNAYGSTDSYNQSVFMYDLDAKLRQKESPANGTLAYEFRALEAVLISVTLALESEFEGVSEPVVRVLRELEEDIDRDKLRYLLIYSKKLGTFEQKARLVRDSLTELLEADDDLSAMYLSEKAEGKVRNEHDHTEVEMLLESYHKVADEIVQAAENLVSSIRNTEEIVKAILDANRNSLMLLDIKFSILTLAITAGTFVAALYGMNLKNFLEESGIGFFGISAWCTVFGLLVATYGLTRLRKVQRVSMWGHGHGSGGTRVDGFGEGLGLGAVSRLRPGETLGDLVKRESAVARKLARAEAKAEESFKG
ncbi:cora-domain-containing protein [Lindgomyces ingoldianus]|uniref:Cora-domain-containing protein n=1 Tax=Lindgomyces ingoldianus TaxID=673940 RepID=A0ACB6QG78_9PLEO|nr:cora-domain-containing protein [Lindgomyces ingoldianus]KAF2465988.1 cora-domain-containing protein [Lindgomyces ingoldianus]